MSTPFVTFPGTAGNYVSTDDVNLLDADTAHTYQSNGQWKYTTVTPQPLAFSGYSAKFSTMSTARFLTESGTAGTPVSASTEYTSAFSFLAAVDCKWRSRFEYYDAAGASISSDIGNYSGTITADTPSRSSQTVTTPALTAFVRLSLDLQLPAGGNLEAAAEVWDCMLAEGTDASFVPSLRIVGDLDLRAKLAADDWTPSATMQIFDAYTSNKGFAWIVLTDGRLYTLNGDGSGPRESYAANPGLTNGTAHELRYTMDVSSGTVLFYIDGAQTSDTNSETAAASEPSGDDLTVGASGTGTNPFDGNIYWCEVRDGIGDSAPVVARFDAADVAAVLP